MAKKKALGFGFIPEETKHHFLVVIPTKKNEPVKIYERFSWDDGELQKTDVNYENLKARISLEKWKQIEKILTNEFNNRLKEMNIVVGRFKRGQTPVERLLGKEMVLLVWAIENEMTNKIPLAIKNWMGLSPEERWWLFTMANAVTGHADDNGRGWRVAIRYALCDNPVDETRDKRLAEFIFKSK